MMKMMNTNYNYNGSCYPLAFKLAMDFNGPPGIIHPLLVDKYAILDQLLHEKYYDYVLFDTSDNNNNDDDDEEEESDEDDYNSVCVSIGDINDPVIDDEDDEPIYDIENLKNIAEMLQRGDD